MAPNASSRMTTEYNATPPKKTFQTFHWI